MAERLRTFDFTAQSAITAAMNKGRNRYPWNEWFDGDIWKLTQGEDFFTSPLMMERIIRTRASNKNQRAKVTLRHIPALNGDSPSIVMQRTDIVGPTEAKRADQARQRAARKQAAEQDAERTLQAAGITPKKSNSTMTGKKSNADLTPRKSNGIMNGKVAKVSKRPSKRVAAPA